MTATIAPATGRRNPAPAPVITDEQAAARIARLNDRRIDANAAPYTRRPDNDTHDRWERNGYYPGQWRRAHERITHLQQAAEELAERIERETELPPVDDHWQPDRYEDAQRAADRTRRAADILRRNAADLTRQVLRSAPPDYQREIAAAG